MNKLEANPSFSTGNGRREGKVHSEIQCSLSFNNAMITLCAEAQGRIPLTQA